MTRFRTETDYFTVVNCEDFQGFYEIPASPVMNSFIFASDTSRYSTCYTRPAFGYMSNIYLASETMSVEMNTWTLVFGSEISISPISFTLVDINLNSAINYNSSCYSS